ncbi:LysM peptidoglycan-binding domain-containing protein [Paenibacillus sp. 1011MAR3C5]|uniref:3D domain-containing protein n=1 Tax=Paenibacillus sp. 1011MAR3C5 TaxID=1675787 RepID=UPI000E6BBD94|nr:3D domain-containing protein [Paenibacillus sp. 1011MAR3C5]RJE88897.1 LysM peptidoglycan-binding domain-containing protein [Paenibacillus sp. 1011MAR3C5]
MKKAFLASAAIALSITLSAGTAHASAGTHTVTNKDTFWTLSQQYKVPLQTLMNANASVDPMNLQIGMKLSIPGQGQSSETMKAMADSTTAIPLASGGHVQGPGGYDYTYTDQMSLTATAYTAAASENGKWGGVDYFGNKLKVGTIAVDPKMIPLGTKLYITGYTYDGLPSVGIIATATDMGGSIKGNRIDIFVPGSTQQAMKFGIQNIEAYILK